MSGQRGPAGLVRRWSLTKKENKKYPPFPADILAEQPHVHDVAAFYGFLPFHFFSVSFQQKPRRKRKAELEPAIAAPSQNSSKDTTSLLPQEHLLCILLKIEK